MRVYKSTAHRHVYQLEIRDHKGRTQRFSTRMTDRRYAQLMGIKIDRITHARILNDPMPLDVVYWIRSGMPPWLSDKLIAWGMIDRELVASGHPLVEHAIDWRQSILDGNATLKHADAARRQVMVLVKAMGVKRYNELNGEMIKSTLAEMGRSGMSLSTRIHHLHAIKGFCRWMNSNDRATTNPVQHINLSLKAEAQIVHKRRPLTQDEFKQLYQSTMNLPVRNGKQCKMDPPQRALLYWLAVSTGFRLSELASLFASNFELDYSPPTVRVTARHSKNSRERVIPIHTELAMEMWNYLEDNNMYGALIFYMPAKQNVAARFAKDLLAAGLARMDGDRIDTRNELGEVLDFHCLRHTAITWWLDHYGLSVRKVQDLAGLSNPQLVARYSRRARLDDNAWLDRAPCFSVPKKDQQPEGGQNA